MILSDEYNFSRIISCIYTRRNREKAEYETPKTRRNREKENCETEYETPYSVSQFSFSPFLLVFGVSYSVILT